MCKPFATPQYPTSSTLTKALESIQKRFLKFMFLKTFKYYPSDVEYEELLQGFEIHSLKARRTIASLLFLHDIIIVEPELLSKINLQIPRMNSRIRCTFYSPTSRTGIMRNSVTSRAMYLYNKIHMNCPDCDVFHQSRNDFCRIIVQATSNL